MKLYIPVFFMFVFVVCGTIAISMYASLAKSETCVITNTQLYTGECTALECSTCGCLNYPACSSIENSTYCCGDKCSDVNNYLCFQAKGDCYTIVYIWHFLHDDEQHEGQVNCSIDDIICVDDALEKYEGQKECWNDGDFNNPNTKELKVLYINLLIAIIAFIFAGFTFIYVKCNFPKNPQHEPLLN